VGALRGGAEPGDQPAAAAAVAQRAVRADREGHRAPVGSDEDLRLVHLFVHLSPMWSVRSAPWRGRGAREAPNHARASALRGLKGFALRGRPQTPRRSRPSRAAVTSPIDVIRVTRYGNAAAPSVTVANGFPTGTVDKTDAVGVRRQLQIAHPEGWRDRPCEAPATISARALVTRRGGRDRCQLRPGARSVARKDEGRRLAMAIAATEPAATSARPFGPAAALSCRECGERYDLGPKFACEFCFGPLEVAYDHGTVTREQIAAGPLNIWRYAPLLPVPANVDELHNMKPGLTPLVRADRLAAELGLRSLHVKDDSGNPTHSFKDRVVAIAVEAARTFGFRTLSCSSTGNLAGAVGAAAARAGFESCVFIPAGLE